MVSYEGQELDFDPDGSLPALGVQEVREWLDCALSCWDLGFLGVFWDSEFIVGPFPPHGAFGERSQRQGGILGCPVQSLGLGFDPCRSLPTQGIP